MAALVTCWFLWVLSMTFIPTNESRPTQDGNQSGSVATSEKVPLFDIGKHAQKSLEKIIHLQQYKNKASRNLPVLREPIYRSSNTTTPPQNVLGLTRKETERVVTESDFISYCQTPQGVPDQKGVISFVLDTRDENSPPLQAMNANIWIRVFVRRRRNRNRKRNKNIRGKKIKLHVLRVQNNTEDALLTTLMTRVKKTKWQKLDLPITFIQSLLDSDQKVLNLRITCENCGKRITPILWKRFKRKRTGRRRLANKKPRKQRRPRNLRSQDRPPFLVIRTRYAYPVSGYNRI